MRPQIGLRLVLGLARFVKYNLVTLVVIMIFEDTAAFQLLVNVLYFVLEHHYCGDQQWRSLT